MTGEFQTIVDAPDKDTAVEIAIQRLLAGGHMASFLMSVSETGFDLRGSLLVSMIPLLRQAGVDLPPEHQLIEKVCKILGKDPANLGEDLRRWILEGGDD